MSYPQLSILIPAAGASRRLGQAKQLVRYKNGTLIQKAVDMALSIGPREVIVVTGAEKEAVEDAVKYGQVRWVHNSDWPEGMGSSIATGAAAISPGSSGALILLCDQWRLQTEDLQLVAEQWQANPQRIVCARAESQNMPPAIFPAGFLGQLRSLGGDKGARQILKEHHESLRPVALKNALFDLDTVSDLDHFKRSSL